MNSARGLELGAARLISARLLQQNHFIISLQRDLPSLMMISARIYSPDDDDRDRGKRVAIQGRCPPILSSVTRVIFHLRKGCVLKKGKVRNRTWECVWECVHGLLCVRWRLDRSISFHRYATRDIYMLENSDGAVRWCDTRVSEIRILNPITK